MRIRLSAAALVVLAACSTMQSGSSGDDVMFTVEPTTVAAGDSILLGLDNGTAEQIGYNLCASSLERQTQEGWALLTTEVVCTMELRLLEPGQAGSYPMWLPAGLTPGEYRYRTTIHVMQRNETHQVTSNTFRVN